MPFRFARNVRTLTRLRTIAQVLTKHGFGHLVDYLELGRLVPLWRKRPAADGTELRSSQQLGVRLARVFTDLGPTFIKLGQMLSTRPDLFPGDIIEGLRSLQDHVDPFPSEESKQIIATDLGISIQKAFLEFQDMPFASGSIAQVHDATTHEGLHVVVKVQRPGIATTIRNDMHLLKVLAEMMEHYLPELRLYHPMLIVEEFERTITRELDFVNEASITSRFHREFENDANVIIPSVIWELTGNHVLTLQKIEGHHATEALGHQTAGYDRIKLAHQLTYTFMKQFFETGLFHADPHPGNILFMPPSKIALIDFGMTGHVSDEIMTQLLVALLAAVNREVDLIVDVISEIGQVGPTADMSELRRDVRTFLDKYYGLPLKRLDLPRIVSEITDIVRHNDITMPRDSVLLAKSLAMVSGVALQLDPDMDLLAVIQSRLRQLMRRRFSADRLLKGAGLSLWHIVNILKNAPAQLRRAIRNMTRGHWQINIRHQNLDRLSRELDRSSNRISFSLIISSMIIGSSMMLAADPNVHVFGLRLQWFGIAGYVIAGLMGLGLVWAIFRSGRLY